MQCIEVQHRPDEEVLGLAHPDNWGSHVLGSPDNLPVGETLAVDALPDTRLRDRAFFALGRRSLIRFDLSSAETAAIFSSGSYDINDRPDVTFVGLDQELAITDQNNIVEPTRFIGIEPASAPIPPLGTVSVRLGTDVLHIRSFTVARIMPGVGILALGLRENKQGRPPAFGLDLLPANIKFGEVTGAQEVLAKVNAIHALRRKQ